MTPATALDRMAAVPAGELLRDAEALLRVVVWPDEPACRIIDLAVPDGHEGLSHGSGHRLARAHGCSDGIAVLVAFRRMLARWLALFDGYDLAPAMVIEAARRYARPVEQTACHEAAHALASPIDEPLTDDAQVRLLRQLAIAPVAVSQVTPEAEGHGAPWAAGAAILYGRAARLRPAVAETWHEAARREFSRYGLEYDAVVRQVACIGDDEPLRALLCDPIWLARIERVIPPLADRAALIAARKPNTVPADGPSNTADDPHDESDGAPC